MYRSKLDSEYYLSKSNIDCLAKYLDAPNERSQESDSTARLIGLYLWDKRFRYQPKLSQMSTIVNSIKSYGKDKPEDAKIKTVRYYQRVFRSTRDSIEQGLYLPLA